MYEIIKVTDNVYDELYPRQCLIDFTIPKTSHAVPVLIYFHGGDLECGGRSEGFIHSFAAEYGVAVASVDYRIFVNFITVCRHVVGAAFCIAYHQRCI